MPGRYRFLLFPVWRGLLLNDRFNIVFQYSMPAANSSKLKKHRKDSAPVPGERIVNLVEDILSAYEYAYLTAAR